MRLVHRFSFTVAPSLQSATFLRQLVTCFVQSSRELDGVDRFALELLTSETVSNAVRHGEGTVEMALTVADGKVRVEVSDAGEGEPVVLDARPDEPLRGRGMMLVAQAADAWGVERHAEGGKVVWFELDVPHEV